MTGVMMQTFLDAAQQAYDGGAPEGYEKIFDLKDLDGQGTGLNGAVFRSHDDGRVILSIAGTEDFTDVVSDIHLGLNQWKLLREWIDSRPPQLVADELFITGHSLGGGLAQYAAVHMAARAPHLVTFNALGAEEGLRQLESWNPQVAAQLSRAENYVVDGDIIARAGGAHVGRTIGLSSSDSPFLFTVAHRLTTVQWLLSPGNEARVGDVEVEHLDMDALQAFGSSFAKWVEDEEFSSIGALFSFYSSVLETNSDRAIEAPAEFIVLKHELIQNFCESMVFPHLGVVGDLLQTVLEMEEARLDFGMSLLMSVASASREKKASLTDILRFEGLLRNILSGNVPDPADADPNAEVFVNFSGDVSFTTPGTGQAGTVASAGGVALDVTRGGMAAVPEGDLRLATPDGGLIVADWNGNIVSLSRYAPDGQLLGGSSSNMGSGVRAVSVRPDGGYLVFQVEETFDDRWCYVVKNYSFSGALKGRNVLRVLDPDYKDGLTFQSRQRVFAVDGDQYVQLRNVEGDAVAVTSYLISSDGNIISDSVIFRGDKEDSAKKIHVEKQIDGSVLTLEMKNDYVSVIKVSKDDGGSFQFVAPYGTADAAMLVDGRIVLTRHSSGREYVDILSADSFEILSIKDVGWYYGRPESHVIPLNSGGFNVLRSGDPRSLVEYFSADGEWIARTVYEGVSTARVSFDMQGNIFVGGENPRWGGISIPVTDFLSITDDPNEGRRLTNKGYGGPLEGGTGNDIYIVQDNSRDVRIADMGGEDRIRLVNGLSVMEYRRNGQNMILSTSSGTLITIFGFFNGRIIAEGAIEFLETSEDIVQLSAVRLGTEGSDILTGSEKSVIFAEGGDDIVFTGSSGSIVYGGAGNDTLFGGVGDDVYHLRVGDGWDTIQDAGGKDTIVLEGFDPTAIHYKVDGEDLMIGTEFESYGIRLKGFYSKGAQRIETLLMDGGVVEFLNPWAGSPWFTSSSNIYGTRGDDHLYSALGGLTKGFAGNDVLHGSRNDTLVGGAGNDKLYGAASNAMYGGDGDDHLSGEDHLASYTGGVCFLYGGNGNDQLYGGSRDTAFGGDGDDFIVKAVYQNGGAGNDKLHGEAGSTLFGGDGNDALYGGRSLVGGAGQDRLYGGDGTLVLRGGADDDILYGRTGYSWTYRCGGPLLWIMGEVASDGSSVYGDDGDDVLYSGDVQYGGGGNDTLTGGRRQYGEAGDDIIYALNDRFPPGPPEVTCPLILSDGSSDMIFTLVDGSGSTMWGGDGNDTLFGGAGDDFMIGGEGDDVYQFARNGGTDVIQEFDGRGSVVLADGLAPEELWFFRDGADLELRIDGTSDVITITRWFMSENRQLQSFKTEDGFTLESSKVQMLVNAMATFDPPSGGALAVNEMDRLAVAPTIAAAWTSA